MLSSVTDAFAWHHGGALCGAIKRRIQYLVKDFCEIINGRELSYDSLLKNSVFKNNDTDNNNSNGSQRKYKKMSEKFIYVRLTNLAMI